MSKEEFLHKVQSTVYDFLELVDDGLMDKQWDQEIDYLASAFGEEVARAAELWVHGDGYNYPYPIFRNVDMLEEAERVTREQVAPRVEELMEQGLTIKDLRPTQDCLDRLGVTVELPQIHWYSPDHTRPLTRYEFGTYLLEDEQEMEV